MLIFHPSQVLRGGRPSEKYFGTEEFKEEQPRTGSVYMWVCNRPCWAYGCCKAKFAKVASESNGTNAYIRVVEDFRMLYPTCLEAVFR
jgi:hypothetical protein